jgi:alpha-tubulin suppressor-like RCC1 family protein
MARAALRQPIALALGAALGLAPAAGCFELPPPLDDETPASGGGGQGGAGAGGMPPTGPLPLCGPGESKEGGTCARIVDLVLGSDSSCALASDGTARCWGDNSAGQLGVEPKGSFVGPLVVPNLGGAPNMALAYEHGCLLDDGNVRCWGGDDVGQIAGAGGPQSVPTAIALSQPALAVAAYSNTACARHASAVSCWGELQDGQGFNPGGQAWTATPYFVGGLSDVGGIDHLAVGTFFSCAIVDGGQQIRCWGDNFEGALGDGTNVGSAAAVAVVQTFATPVQELVAGTANSCIRDAQGRVFCWGGMALSDSVPGVDTIYDEPTLVNVGAKPVASIAAGFRHLCLRYEDGTVGCFGTSYFGALGMEGTVASATPLMIADLADVEVLASGWQHLCALRSTGEVICWGHNHRGQVDPSQLGVEAIAAPHVVDFGSSM